MLSEDSIENLVQPLIERQETLNTYVVNTIADRIKRIGQLSAKDVKRLQILVELGADIRKINAELARITELQVKDIKGLIKTVAVDSYIDAKPLYDYRHKSYVPFEKNTPLQRLVTAIGNATTKEYVNISKSKAVGFLIGDVGNRRRLTFKSIDKTYRQVVDEAIQLSQGGILDYKTAIRRTLKQLSDSGVRRLSWESGYTQRLDTAVRRNVMDGIHAIQQAMEDEIGKQIGADAKELSVHQNSALDHEPIQGHIFTNEEYEKLQNDEPFEDIKGNTFDAIQRAIGMWNCRHFAYAFIIGVSKPRYTQAQLDRYIKRNHEGYILPNGKHITMYECTQMQRQMETKIRYAKEEQMMWQQANDKEQAQRTLKKIRDLMYEYKVFSTNCGLKVDLERTKVMGYSTKI